MRQSALAVEGLERHRKRTLRERFLDGMDKVVPWNALCDSRAMRHFAGLDLDRALTKVEHPFLVLKRIFGFREVRCRSLAKNANRLFIACGLVNLCMARRH